MLAALHAKHLHLCHLTGLKSRPKFSILDSCLGDTEAREH